MCRIKGADRLEVRLAGDEGGARGGTGLGFALQQLLVGLPGVTVAGIPTVERAVVTYDDKAKRCACGSLPLLDFGVFGVQGIRALPSYPNP